MENFELVDVARKVVGVGSVGTRAFIGLLQGRDEDGECDANPQPAENDGHRECVDHPCEKWLFGVYAEVWVVRVFDSHADFTTQ